MPCRLGDTRLGLSPFPQLRLWRGGCPRRRMFRITTESWSRNWFTDSRMKARSSAVHLLKAGKRKSGQREDCSCRSRVPAPLLIPSPSVSPSQHAQEGAQTTAPATPHSPRQTRLELTQAGHCHSLQIPSESILGGVGHLGAEICEPCLPPGVTGKALWVCWERHG